MLKNTTVLFILIFITACSPIQKYSNLEQPINQILQADIGSIVLRIDKSEDLKNAFGKKDIWGGKVDLGHQLILFEGIKNDKVSLYVKNVTVKSNEDVFTRYMNNDRIHTSHNANIYANGNYGYINGSSTTTLQKAKPIKREVINNSNHLIELDFKKEKSFEYGGYIIEILKATPFNLTYIIK